MIYIQKDIVNGLVCKQHHNLSMRYDMCLATFRSLKIDVVRVLTIHDGINKNYKVMFLIYLPNTSSTNYFVLRRP